MIVLAFGFVPNLGEQGQIHQRRSSRSCSFIAATYHGDNNHWVGGSKKHQTNHLFSHEFCEIFKNTYLVRSVKSNMSVIRE